MTRSRRGFLQLLAGGAMLPLLPAAAQTKKGMIVRSIRPEDLEMPLDWFADWITPVEHFFVRTHTYVPEVNEAEWKLEIAGEVQNPVTLTMSDLRQLPRIEHVSVLECAGNGRSLYEPHVPGAQWKHGSVGNGRWAGVRLADVLRKAGLKASAKNILLDGADVPPGTMPKFQRSIPMDKALNSNTILAYEMNGRPLPQSHGFPLRVVAPGWAGDSWVKWLTRIHAQEKEADGFFMATAYRHPVRSVAPGTPVDPKQMEPVTTLRVKSVVATPSDGAWLPPGAPVRVRGAAWSGESPVTGVDVSTDSGRTWRSATLGRDRAPFAWRLWEYEWRPPAEGYHVLMARARDASGDLQPLVQDWNPSGYLWNVAQRIGVTVSSKAPEPKPAASPESAGSQAPPKVKAACMVCHEGDVIEQQKLTRGQWEKEVDKMIRWGAKVNPDDREDLLNYLVQFAPGR